MRTPPDGARAQGPQWAHNNIFDPEFHWTFPNKPTKPKQSHRPRSRPVEFLTPLGGPCDNLPTEDRASSIRTVRIDLGT